MENTTNSKKLNIDLADYWMIIRKRFISVLLIFILVVLGSYLYTTTEKPLYQSTAKIKLALRQPMATIQGAQITWYGSRGNEIPSEIKLIKNKVSIREAVLDVLKYGKESDILKNNKNFFSDKNASMLKKKEYLLATRQAIEDNGPLSDYINSLRPADLAGMLSIEQIPKTNIVELKVSNEHKETCAIIANTLAIVYNIDYWKSKTLQAKNQLDFIKGQLNSEIVQQDKTQVKVIETSKREIFSGSADIYKRKLTNMHIELQELSEKHKPKHPRIVKLKKLIQHLEAKLEQIPQAQQVVHESKMEETQSEEFIKDLDKARLKANIDYQAKKSQAQEEIQIIAWASGYSKIRPNIPMNMTIGVIFGIIIGCLFAFIWEGLDTSIGKIEDVERITGLPVIAHIPLIGKQGRQKSFFRPFIIPMKCAYKMITAFIPKKSKEQPLDLDKKVLFNFDAMSVTAEAYRTLRTNIQFAIGKGNKTGNVVSLTSASPKEGKTLTSTNLAISLAQMGKSTLLLEADMRCPQIAGIFKIDEKPGLSDLLIGTAKNETAIRTITDILIADSEWDKLMEVQGLDNLNILPCGTIPPNPTELLISPEFAELIAELRTQYDYIIIDTPPTLPVSDSTIVSTVTDGTLMIYQSDTTSRHLLLRALNSLEKNQTKILGVVINQLSFDVVINSKSQYNYGYGYGYSQHNS
jgi:capsular exopolysaccharide synthesis family protein